MIAQTPPVPYYAVIFTSLRKGNNDGYAAMSDKMEELARLQPGYLGHESARSEVGITVSYWDNLDAIKDWKANVDHQLAQKTGRNKWNQH